MTTIARRDWTEQSGGGEIVHKNDIYVVNGQLAVSSGLEAYKQVLAAAVLTVSGELPLDADAGVPYFGSVFLSAREVSIWEAAVRETALSLPFVSSIASFTYAIDPGKKTLSYVLVVETDAGTVAVNQGSI